MVKTDGIPVWKDIGYRPRLGARQGEAERHEIVIVGAGPVGLALALDLGRRGRNVVVLNALTFISAGSKAICFSKRSLEILDRLGLGERLLNKGVQWETGRVFWKDDPDPIYEFDLLPIKDQQFPAFINIQQYYVEEYLFDEIEKLDNIEVRWGHEAVGVVPRSDGVRLTAETPDGKYTIETDWLVACDGVKSSIRQMTNLDFVGRVFEDNFLIADVKFKQERPTERWFCFEPPYPGASSLVHKQPDDVWRLDFQLGWNIDKQEAVKPENVEPFVRGMLGPGVDFEYVWLSVYTFQCRRMERFVHGRVLFAGDSAHVVSPFGARGCNGGFQDIDNLGWKLDRVLGGRSPESLIESYNEEAIMVANENILNSTRSTDFMTPKSKTAKIFRDAVLELSKEHAFARPFVNSGRLSKAVSYAGSSLNAPCDDRIDGGPAPGDPCIDAPVDTLGGADWLLAQLGDAFVVLLFSDNDSARRSLQSSLDEASVIQVTTSGDPGDGRFVDIRGLAHERYNAVEEDAVYLVRPDQHVAGRWRQADPSAVSAALLRATGRKQE